MEREPIDKSELSKYIGTQLSQEILLGRDYFHCVAGKVSEENSSYTLTDFDYITHEEYGEAISKIRQSVAKGLRGEYQNNVWVKCLPVDPDDCCCEAYINICISVDDEFKIASLAYFVWMDQFYNPLLALTPEITDEIKCLCEAKFLPNNYSLIGKKVTDELKSIFHLNNAGCDYSFHRMSGYRDVTTSFFIDVDENDVIKDVSIATNENGNMVSRPVSDDDEYVDVMDGLIDMNDRI